MLFKSVPVPRRTSAAVRPRTLGSTSKDCRLGGWRERGREKVSTQDPGRRSIA